MQEAIVVTCSRCGMPCKLASTSTEDARLLKKATKPTTSGYCVDCAVTDFFKNHSMLAEIMEGNPAGITMLLDPHAQQGFAQMLSAGNADARPEEINWQRVRDNWELPFKKARRKK